MLNDTEFKDTRSFVQVLILISVFHPISTQTCLKVESTNHVGQYGNKGLP